MISRRELGTAMEISCLKEGGRESVTYVANQRSSSEQKTREPPVKYEARFCCDALQCVEGACGLDGQRNLTALHAQLKHMIGARIGHFHLE